MKNKIDPYLKQIPCLNKHLEYKVINKKVNLIFQNDKKIQKFLRKISFKIPKTTTINLDEYSSYVFLQIDGKTNLYKIGQKAYEEFPDDQDNLYDRLVIFANYLNEKKWITYK